MIIKRAIPFFGVLVVFLLSLSVFAAGCVNVPDEFEIVEEKPSYASDELLSELPPEFGIIAEVWGVLSTDYVNRDGLDAEKLSQGAAKGMLEALGDPYSAYVAPELQQVSMSGLRGKYQGIGAYIGIRDSWLTVIAPIVGTPAEEAGIRAGDIILEIDGESTEGISSTQAALRIQGEAGTAVELLILHQEESEPVRMQIVRREIKLESVLWEMHDNIAYIRITQFIESTGQDFRAALKSVSKEGADGIVLDLRNNPGGILDVVIDVASQFLTDGIVVDIVDNDGEHSKLPVLSGGMATDVPLVVLVNDGSASASEILAGALQDHERAKVAGSRTFGKGSVQIIRNLKDNSALRLTIARWFTPDGRPIDGVGLEPDLSLELEGDELVDWAIDYLREQIAAGRLLIEV